MGNGGGAVAPARARIPSKFTEFASLTSCMNMRQLNRWHHFQTKELKTFLLNLLPGPTQPPLKRQTSEWHQTYERNSAAEILAMQTQCDLRIDADASPRADASAARTLRTAGVDAAGINALIMPSDAQTQLPAFVRRPS